MADPYLPVSIALAVAVYLFNGVYNLLNHGPARVVLQTPVDRAIPVVPIFRPAPIACAVP